MSEKYGKLIRFLTLKNLILICLLISMAGLLFSAVVGYVTWSPFTIIPTIIAGFTCIYLLILLKWARRETYRSLVLSEAYDKYKWASLLWPDIEEFVPERNYVAWITTEKQLVGAKIFAVTDVPTTAKELTSTELEGRLRSYAHLMSTEDVMIATYHIKLPIDKESYMAVLRRQRDVYKSSHEAGGPETHLEEAEKRTEVLQRIEKKLEEPYDARFFVITMAQAKSLDELERKFEDITPTILTRFQSDIGVVIEELKDMELLDACRFFLPPGMLESKITSRKLRPVTALTLDLAWQNPLVARRMPPLGKLLKGIYLGTMLEGNIPVSWSPWLLPNHNVTVIGPMGSGKSTLTKSFAYRAYLMLRIPSWIFDVAAEYMPFIEKLGGVTIDLKEKQINPFVLYDSDPVSVANSLAEMCTYLVGLRGDERFFFRKMALELYEKSGVDPKKHATWTDEASNNVNFEALHAYISKKLRSKAVPTEEVNLARSVLNKTEIFATGAYRMGKGAFTLDELFKSNKPICFVLKGLPEYLQKAFVWSILEQLNSLFYNRYKIHEELRLLVIIEETHLFSKSVPADVPSGIIEPPLAKYVRAMRKLGHGMICVTHSPTDLSPLFLEAVGTLILFGSTDSNYVDFCQKQLHLTPDEVQKLLWMGRGECFIRFFADIRAVPIRVQAEPDVLIEKEGK